MTNKQLQLCSYEQSKRLKALGFDWKCDWFYNLDRIKIPEKISLNWNGNCYSVGKTSAPTVALALKWCRDEKGIFNCVYFDLTSFRKGYYGSFYLFADKTSIHRTETISSYELVESALLDEILTLLENKLI
ncbi:MAG: hypothetical protein FWD66_00945 [Paludibacter sp.]|nr:hypothetical protein [Paludibacter sp.]